MKAALKYVLAMFAVGPFLLGLAGCGERPQVVNYKQGRYQGKPDTPAWQSAQFNNSATDWEKAIKARNQHQNEYRRTN